MSANTIPARTTAAMLEAVTTTTAVALRDTKMTTTAGETTTAVGTDATMIEEAMAAVEVDATTTDVEAEAEAEAEAGDTTTGGTKSDFDRSHE